MDAHLFVAVLGERMPGLGPLLSDLEAGQGDLEQNLAAVARQAALFYQQTFPVLASLYAEPRLKRRHEAAMREMGTGPHKPVQGLDAYLRAEQRAGRVSSGADTYAAASLLLGACSQRAFVYETVAAPQSLDDFAASLARTLLAGIS